MTALTVDALRPVTLLAADYAQLPFLVSLPMFGYLLFLSGDQAGQQHWQHCRQVGAEASADVGAKVGQ